MKELWISPSKVDRFRAMVEGDYNGKVTEEDVIASVTGSAAYTPQANFGTAYHAIIEHGPDKFYNPETNLYNVKIDDMPSKVVLHPEEIRPALKYRNEYPNLKFERWVFHTIFVDNYKVLFLMKVDGLNGLEIHENKTSTYMPYNGGIEESYFKTVQWKLYLSALSASFVQYNHFHYVDAPIGQPREVTYNRFKLYKFPGMDQEIKELTYGLISFCEKNDLVDYLDRNTRKAKLRT